MIGLWNTGQKNGKHTGLLAVYTLHTLQKEPKSGYAILHEIMKKCDNTWCPSKGTLYPLLKQLEEEGLIKIKKVEQRSKNVYQITVKGKKLLTSMHDEMINLKEKFSHFRSIFAEIWGPEKMDMINLLIDIKEVAMTTSDKAKAKRILQTCHTNLLAVHKKEQ